MWSNTVAVGTALCMQGVFLSLLTMSNYLCIFLMLHFSLLQLKNTAWESTNEFCHVHGPPVNRVLIVDEIVLVDSLGPIESLIWVRAFISVVSQWRGKGKNLGEHGYKATCWGFKI
jgi:hypothetical protein